jgi:hypothetical protein
MRRVAVLVGGLAALVVMQGPVLAQDGTMRSWLGTLGIIDRDREEIEIRERAPLVVPSNRELPSPEDPNRVEGTTSWPRDPDVASRRAAATGRGQPSQNFDEKGRVLRPGELSSGPGYATNAPGRTTKRDQEGRTVSSVAAGREALMPSELGFRGFNFGSSASEERKETATFTAEPTRRQLTDPPVGLRTPAPTQPYGITSKPTTDSGTNAFSRLFSGWNVGSNR